MFRKIPPTPRRIQHIEVKNLTSHAYILALSTFHISAHLFHISPPKLWPFQIHKKIYLKKEHNTGKTHK
jgi:hypothetical protein